jgi:hypothetical protein
MPLCQSEGESQALAKRPIYCQQQPASPMDEEGVLWQAKSP